MSPKPRNFRPSLAIVVLALVASGCVGRPNAGVTVKNFPSQLVFGIAPLPDVVAPPNTLPADILPVTGVGGIPTGREPPPPKPADFECIDAPLGTAPNEAAPEDIRQPPAVGTYRYKNQFRLVDLHVAESGFESRTVSDARVTNPAGPNLTFRTTQRLLQGPVDLTVISTFSVDQTSPRPERRGPTEIPQVSARGIFLTRVERRGKVGNEEVSGTFVPNPPLKYFDLPGRLGSDGAFDTTAVDSSSFTTIRHQGEATRHEPVDACGTVTDSWYVEALQTVTAPNGQRFETKFNYGVATHLGGLIILEHIEIPANDPDVIFDFWIAELKPSS